MLQLFSADSTEPWRMKGLLVFWLCNQVVVVVVVANEHSYYKKEEWSAHDDRFTTAKHIRSWRRCHISVSVSVSISLSLEEHSE